MRKILIGLAMAIGFAATSQPALAWGEQGHASVCELAYRNFTPTARSRLADLFKAWSARHRMGWSNTRNEELLYRRFMKSCMFEDVVKQRPELSKFKDQPGHFVNYPRTKLSVPDHEAVCSHTASGQEVKCVFRVLERDLARFRDSGAPAADRAEALIGIGHWLGDIHQPLHVSFQDDKGGGDIAVKGECGTSVNLHSVWDTCLIMKGIWGPLRQAKGFRATSNKRTIAFRLVDNWRASEDKLAVKAEVASWIAKTEPWQWAQEGYGITLAGSGGGFTDNQYCFKQGGKCSYSQGQDEFDRDGTARRVEITPAYVGQFAPVVERRLRQAGYRLAWIVNNTLDPAWDRKLPTCSVSLGTCPS